MKIFPFLIEKKKKDKFVQEYAYIEEVPPEKEQTKKQISEEERGVIVIDLR